MKNAESPGEGRMKNAECRIMATVALVALSFLPSRGLWASTDAVRVKVDAGQVVRTVDTRLFGMNVVMWDACLDTPETLTALRELDVQALRFPGGSPSDDYHWAFNRNGRNEWHWATPFSGFVHLATNLHAQVFSSDRYVGTVEACGRWDERGGAQPVPRKVAHV
jgi:hypothetical protein